MDEIKDMNTVMRRPYNITSLYPYALLLVAGLGVGLTLAIQRPDLFYFSLLQVIPLVLGAVVLLINRNVNFGGLVMPLSQNIRFSSLLLINVSVFIGSLIFLISDASRPLIYFILVSIYSGIILLQITTRRPKWTDNVIVVEILFLSLNLVWGVTLKYPLYFGDTDTLVHLNLIDTILNSDHIQNYEIYYQYYPLYHIFSAIGVDITGISLKVGLFVFMGLAWQIGIIFSYLIFRKLCNSNNIALVACLLFASGSQLIFYGSYAIARSLAFVFLICWMYLIFDKAKKEPQYLFISVIIMSAMIMTHHLTVFFVIPLMFLIYFCQLFIKRFRQTNLINPIFIYLLTVCSVSYLIWVASNMANSQIPTTIRDLFNSELFSGGDFTRGYGFSVILGAVYYSFVLFLGLIGIKGVFNNIGLAHKMTMAGIICLAGFFMLVLYIPGPLELLNLSNIVLSYRLPLLVSPCIALLIAYGIKFLYTKRTFVPVFPGASYLPVLPLVLVIALTFFSTISTGNANDTNYLINTATINSPYFSNPELMSFSFLNEKADNKMTLYSDYQTVRNDYLLNKLASRNILEGGDISYIENGYLTLRTSEFNKKKALTFSSDGSINSKYVYRYSLDQVDPESDIISNLKNQARIYSDRDVQIYIVQNKSLPISTAAR